MNNAPLFVQALDLYTWLLDRLESQTQYASLQQKILLFSQDLLDNVVLALKGHEKSERIKTADQQVQLLTVYLRLAEKKCLLEERQYQHSLNSLREIGRQLGNWYKKVGCP